MSGMIIKLDEKNFNLLSSKLRELAGINLPLNPKNLTLVSSRLMKVMNKLHIDSYKAYIALLEKGDTKVVGNFISALTTNTTQFFRENVHFDVLKKVIPEIIKRKRSQDNYEIRVWCAAASTGQEPYSMVMTLLEEMPDIHYFTFKFLATDIDQRVLERCAKGIYSADEMKNVWPLYRQKYFSPLETGKGTLYQVVPEVRKLIRFAAFNLDSVEYPFQHPFDIIFCRNVLIYFDVQRATTVINKLVNCLAGTGYLFLGHAEAGLMRNNKVKRVIHAAYQRIGEEATIGDKVGKETIIRKAQ